MCLVLTPQPAWDEEVPVMRYIRYTAEELAAQAEAKKKAEEAAAAEAKKRQSWKPCRAAWTLWKRQTTTLCL